jgi:hypothetical protein
MYIIKHPIHIFLLIENHTRMYLLTLIYILKNYKKGVYDYQKIHPISKTLESYMQDVLIA